jgi:CheY-like chemotaxis protein
MDAATRQRIFEPFFTTKEAGRGTGPRPRHRLRHRPNSTRAGSRSRAPPAKAALLRLPPLRPGPDRSRGTLPRQTAQPTNGTETILLVEDDLVTRQTIGLTLRRDGYHVLEANTAESALVLWEQHRASIAGLITDVIMPGGRTGLELANQLHAQDTALSIIIISGYSDDAIRNTPVVEGATYLAKPFDYATLTLALRTSLARHSK